MFVTFDHSEPVAEDIRSFWFKPAQPVRYTAGQFTELRLPDGQFRRFTLSSSPTEELLAITTRLGAWSSQFKQTLLTLQPGDRLRADDPLGDLVLPKDPTRPLVFVAGGIGVTPFRSIIKWLHDTGERRQIQFLYAVTYPARAAFLDVFRTAGHEPTVLVGGHQLTPERIITLTRADDSTLIYLSGPDQMVQKLGQALGRYIRRENIITDAFLGYSTPL